MIFVFWLSIIAVVAAYAGYPLVLMILGMLRKRSVQKDVSYLPRVSIIIAAYNEETVVENTVKNKLSLDYPHDLMEIIVVSDASTDKTDELVRKFEPQGVRLIVQPHREGKTAALNRAYELAQGEILVMSDANSMYDVNALRKLISNFSDPDVGYVTGHMIYVDEAGSVIGDGCSAYMKYENRIRRLETNIGSVVGVDGGIDAVRKSLFEPMRPELLPDFVLPLSVVERGFRVVYEPEARLMESVLNQSRDEFRMRVRVILRSFYALIFKRRLFNPFKYGFFAFQLFMHKVLRYSVGLFQIMALVSNFYLVRNSSFFATCLVMQISFYSLAVLGYIFERKVNVFIFRYPYYLCLLNVSSLVALLKLMKGENFIVWKPREG